MVDLDTSALSPEIAMLLMQRGSELPPLQWADGPNQFAKKTLDAIEDSNLFARDTFADEGMAAAVRALLYLWNGWLGDCEMYAQAVPDKERLYMAGLCERYKGNPIQAKEINTQLNGHPIYNSLTAYAIKAIGNSTDAALNRFKQILKIDSNWEAFAFIDLYEQARADKLGSAAGNIVRGLLCKEFELLFVHCYEAALGEPLPKRPQANPTSQRPPRRPVQRRQQPRAPEQSKQKPTPANSQNIAKRAKNLPVGLRPGMIGIVCPKCQEMATVPESSRGQSAKCAKCGALFVIPQKKEASVT